jgi:hypothetical protein
MRRRAAAGRSGSTRAPAYERASGARTPTRTGNIANRLGWPCARPPSPPCPCSPWCCRRGGGTATSRRSRRPATAWRAARGRRRPLPLPVVAERVGGRRRRGRNLTAPGRRAARPRALARSRSRARRGRPRPLLRRLPARRRRGGRAAGADRAFDVLTPSSCASTRARARRARRATGTHTRTGTPRRRGGRREEGAAHGEEGTTTRARTRTSGSTRPPVRRSPTPSPSSSRGRARRGPSSSRPAPTSSRAELAALDAELRRGWRPAPAPRW